MLFSEQKECSGCQQSAVVPRVLLDTGYSCRLSSLDSLIIKKWQTCVSFTMHCLHSNALE